MTSPQIPNTYDEVPYIRVSFVQTHPDRLSTIAQLFGMTPPPIGTARVLELGCASGDNLVPMAYSLPDAKFVGVDLSRTQVDLGLAMVAALKLTNIELKQADILEIDPSWGRFDYIICHGIYSWVPEPVREKILDIFRDNLTENGVAYVSYNTYPGWHMRGLIREMMLFHAGQFDTAQAKIGQARALLDFLAQSAPTNTPYGMTVRQELDALRGQPDAYIAHEHLEVINQPFYFHEVARAADRHGLQFLGEAEFSAMMVTNFTPQVQETLRKIAPDIIRMEQYMDFVRNRTFRQTLFVHKSAAVTRGIDAQKIRGWHLASNAAPASRAPSIAPGVPEKFSRKDLNLTTNAPIVKAAFLALAAHWPATMSFEELVQAGVARMVAEGAPAPSAEDLEGLRMRLALDMFQAFSATMVELRTDPAVLCLEPGEKPLASPVARLQSDRHGPVTNLRHEAVSLDPFSTQLLRLMDGTRDRDALVDALAFVVRQGGLEVKQAGQPVGDIATIKKILGEAVHENIPKLARLGLLVA